MCTATFSRLVDESDSFTVISLLNDNKEIDNDIS